MKVRIFNVYIIIYFICIYILIVQCQRKNESKRSINIKPTNKIQTQVNTDSLGEIEKIFLKNGLVSVSDLDTTIKLDLKYASVDNFTGINLYGNLKKCYLQKDVIIKLILAQKLLKQIKPDYSLIIFDGARPKHIQQLMWQTVKMPIDKKIQFLSNPALGSLHNYGAAVDISIIDCKINHDLDMGTPFDFLGEKAMPVFETKMLKQNMLTNKQVENRKLLRQVMSSAGFANLPTEWWHFNSCSRKEASQHYAFLRLPEKTFSDEDMKMVSKQDICFSVQLKASEILIDLHADEFQGLSVKMYQHLGMYKYITGKYTNIDSAYEECGKTKKNTSFKDAFVVAFNKGKRIGLKDAIEISM